MQTSIHKKYANTPEGIEADAILRSCVHCGFCTATCPTYQLLGDELDSPRGRIYLIKQVLEGNAITRSTQIHLDRCLTCRSCETTCPSGVRYSRLVDIGRNIVEKNVKRPVFENITRWSLRHLLTQKGLFTVLLRLGQSVAPLLPTVLKQKIPPRRSVEKTVTTDDFSRRMLILEGCVQPATSPNTNAATTRILAKLGITIQQTEQAGCCGAVSHHLSAHEAGLNAMRNNIDAWWPSIEAGAEAIIMTASGCGAMVKEYADLLANDTRYAEKAARVSELCKDISEVLADENLSSIRCKNQDKKYSVAFHSPCTLQHGQKINGSVESILENAGFNLVEVNDSHLCCGSAGTYSILQPKLSQQLLKNKVSSLIQDGPDYIVTANIGCQLHLQTKITSPVMHWIELLDQACH